ncbi:MAG: hypothetical protein RJB66_1106 [Pseudomonadota bacterium]|jgi:hypothetical protein
MHEENRPVKGALWGALLFFVVFSSIGCTPAKKTSISHQIWLPWMGANGAYSVQKIQLDTVTSWAPLNGGAAQLRSHVLRIDENTLSSQDILLEYSQDKSGAIIPLTRFSTEVASIYAHLEKMQKLDKELSLPDSDVARKVYVKFIEDLGGGQIMTNNAFYDAAVDSFFVVPYRRKGLPLSVNGAVLAHEHFHSIFARLLLLPLLKNSEAKKKNILNLNEFTPHLFDFSRSVFNVFSISPPFNRQNSKIEDHSKNIEVLEVFKTRFLNRTILRGLNEGLADVWGWMYSSDPCFMTLSFDKSIGDERCLKSDQGSPSFFTVEDLGKKYSPWLDKAGQERQAVKYGYELGSSLARMVYVRLEERGELNDLLARRQWAKRIVEVLPTFLPHFIKVYVEDEMRVSVAQWEKIVDTLLFGPGSPQIPSERCEKWLAVLKTKENLENFNSRCRQ